MTSKKNNKKTLFKPPVNGEWIVHVGESVSLDMILYQVLQKRSLFWDANAFGYVYKVQKVVYSHVWQLEKINEFDVSAASLDKQV